MNPDDSSRKKHRFLLILILLILLIIATAIWYFWPRPDRMPLDDSGQSFSPFDRSPIRRPDDGIISGAPYRPVVTQPSTSTSQAPTQIPSYTIESDPTRETFYVNGRDSFVIPGSQPQEPAPERTVYEYNANPIAVSPGGYYVPTITRREPEPGTPGKPVREDTLMKIDKQLFGIVTGLGILRLFGDSGEELFDELFYGLGGPLGVGPGKNGPGFGGGFGGSGGSGGSETPFGGEVTNITYCTCNASTLLDINDVNNGSVSLLYSAATSDLYMYYNVFGTGQNVLGTYSSGGGSCMVYNGESCDTEGNPDGTIVIIGTSE